MNTISICTSLQQHAATAELDTLAKLVADLSSSLQRAYGELDEHLRGADTRG